MIVTGWSSLIMSVSWKCWSRGIFIVLIRDNEGTGKVAAFDLDIFFKTNKDCKILIQSEFCNLYLFYILQSRLILQ